MRTPVKKKTTNLTEEQMLKPLGEKLEFSLMLNKENDCFGIMWDMTTNECANCADNEVCGILVRADIAKRVKAADKGTFLDKTDFDNVDEKELVAWMKKGSGKVTLQKFVDHVTKLSQCPDEETVVIWLKRFLTKYKKEVYTKGGFVWERL